MLSPGFLLGDPNSKEGFYFLADLVLPEKKKPGISARLFDTEGKFLMELICNKIGENPGRCSYQSIPDGFRLLYASGETLLEVHTQTFAKGYLTRIQGKLYDGDGRLRMEPAYEGSQVFEEAELALNAPFKFSNS